MGMFSICSDTQNNSTLISNQFIDTYMKDANEAQIKTYLYLVRMMSAGRSTSISQMADVFNHTEKEISRSLAYWERQGLLRLETDEKGELCAVYLCQVSSTPSVDAGIHLSSHSPSLPSAAELPFSADPTPSTGSLQKKASSLPEERTARQDQEISIPSITIRCPVPKTAGAKTLAPVSAQRSALFFIVEQYIGKPLSAMEMQKINYIADDLHFSDDLIDFLVQYCVGIGKKDFRYIEKVALNWSTEGISTTSQARENIARGPQYKTTARTAAGIKSRSSNATGKKSKKSSNSFNQFSQNEYDFEELEKQLLKHQA